MFFSSNSTVFSDPDKKMIEKLQFDKEDKRLLSVVNEVPSQGKALEYPRKIFYSHFHPHGIKEMAESEWMRMATAVVYLLDSLEVGKMNDRLIALRCLHEELLTTAEGSMPRNTARVLLEIMKELVRSRGDYGKQLRLAHDFRIAASGKPRIVRAFLNRYHLLEMPEQWNQIAFDDHVHDANTKGRKSATHLIMDAWIKGVRFLKVVYYNYIRPRSAAELLEAAKIMGIHVRIGIEFSSPYRDKYVHLIWAPRGFPDSESFLCFLAEEPVAALMEEGRKVSEYQEQYVIEVIHSFNERHLPDINRQYGLNLAPIDPAEFRASVKIGQLSVTHLGKFIFQKMLPAMKNRVSQLTTKYREAEPEEQSAMENLVEDMNRIDIEVITDRYLSPEQNPDVRNPESVSDKEDVPTLLNVSPKALLERLVDLYPTFRVTLNLSNLYVEDVLELLYDCEGIINRLEIYNLKDYAKGKTDHVADIAELQNAINKANVIALKRIIRNILERLKRSDYPDREDRINKISEILHDIITLKNLYTVRPLKSRMGSDSTGQSPRIHGMGLAIMETLPLRAQRELKRNSGGRHHIVPMNVRVNLQVTYKTGRIKTGFLDASINWPLRFKIIRRLFQKGKENWFVHEERTNLFEKGNIVTIGGVEDEHSNGFSLEEEQKKKKTTSHKFSWSYLNSGSKNIIKVLSGFIPAFATFFFLYDWWFLACFGAFIWFSITGLRNIVQSVLGGGGVKRSPLVRWNDYVSWDRVSDSLMYTGFSVPLLDLFMKNIVLNHGFNINTSTNPMALYAFMGLANGIYISSHNIFRGLPPAAAVGNFFRSILSIPIAIGFNSIIGGILIFFQVPGVNDILQKWAAVISKLASDCVAGVIEGAADRQHNIEMRFRDYENKMNQLFNVYAELEMLFPEEQVQEIFTPSKKSFWCKNSDAYDLITIVMINALDQLYFWMYQPRARTCLAYFVRNMSPEERQVFMKSQFILQKHKEISLLFVDGIVGNNFMKPLAFYLDRSDEYLKAIQKRFES